MIPSTTTIYPTFNLQPELDFRTHMLTYLTQFYCMPAQEEVLESIQRSEATKSDMEWESVSHSSSSKKRVGRPRKSLTESYDYIYARIESNLLKSFDEVELADNQRPDTVSARIM